ncbi:uncharacterized protein [Miscanthus floridulus]|uniref:uncharacterized protein isoform X1 n=1 Tax=Miscanthus floridulus TaxID=154761 RepID=UPI0034579DA8
MARAEQESLAAPLLEPTATARQRVPFVEVRLYRRGDGPVAIFRSDLSGPGRDRLDVRRIQANHGIRALFAFRPEGPRRGRGLRIRCDPAAGYSALPFRDGTAIALDGESRILPSHFLSSIPRHTGALLPSSAPSVEPAAAADRGHGGH